MDEVTPPTTEQHEKPVAYDADGQPLYAHPTQVEEQTHVVMGPAVVHVARSMTPLAVEIPPELMERHEKSVKLYPQLDLSEHEYVIRSVRRHAIGLVAPFAMTLLMISLIISGLFLLPQIVDAMAISAANFGLIYMLGILACAVLGIGMYVLYWVYVNNTFFLTNESVIEKTQLSLFSSNVKSVGLGDVVDVSYRQTGLIQELFNFGTVQVGTKDDEVPYVFNTVRNPKAQASILKEAVEAFKNGRPVVDVAEE